MKNFIKLSFITLALTLASNASAQLLPISLGVKGGINSSTLSTDDYKSKSGFNAGITLDFNLPANLAIMSGLEVSTKGAKMKAYSIPVVGGPAIDIPESKINATYLHLPLHLGYRIKVIPGFRLHLEAGPYFAQGIGGKSEIPTDDVAEMTKVKTFSKSEGLMKKSDWGLGVGAGATILGMIKVRAGYDFGMKNVSRIDGMKIKNRNFYTSVGFNFF